MDAYFGLIMNQIITLNISGSDNEAKRHENHAAASHRMHCYDLNDDNVSIQIACSQQVPEQ